MSEIKGGSNQDSPGFDDRRGVMATVYWGKPTDPGFGQIDEGFNFSGPCFRCYDLILPPFSYQTTSFYMIYF